MKNTILLFATIATLISVGTVVPAFAKMPAGDIPPNCTIDPWTGEMHCHKWPKK